MLAQVVTSIETRQLDKVFTYEVPEAMRASIAIGKAVEIPFGKGNRLISGYVVDLMEESPYEGLKEISGYVEGKGDSNEVMIQLAWWMKETYFIPLSSALKLMFTSVGSYRESYEGQEVRITEEGREAILGMRRSKRKDFLEDLLTGPLSYEESLGRISAAIFRDLKIKGLIEVVKNKREKKCYLKALNTSQEKVFRSIEKSIAGETGEHFLLFGVTGSGKTEVYFKSIEKALEKNQQVLVLLPEIQLTEQMIHRFEAAFPGRVAKWHSQMSHGAKKKIYEELASGDKEILIGPRSAVFTPMKHLGLIIVDEEHDTSYYQSTMPVYDGREVALKRGELEVATVVLGTGTPSLESIYQAGDGNLHFLELKEKYYGQENPDIQIVDMAEELQKGNMTFLSADLEKEIVKAKKRGEQTILFLNRRGFANFILCRDCGHVIRCEACDISMTYHRPDRLVCHYCQREMSLPSTCPECGSRRIKGMGLGTEQVVEYIEEKLPGIKVERLDQDVLGGKGNRQRIIEDVKSGRVDVLVGTQMITKGIDFPNVGLVGILLGDLSLNFPDYRAREWTFNLLMQVIGRTGRRKKKGKVLLQTYRPFDIIYRDIENFDYQGFYQRELAFRKKMLYPPYGELFKLHVGGEDENKVIKKCWEIYDSLKIFFDHGELFPPKKEKRGKVNHQYRWQLLVKLKRDDLSKESILREYMLGEYGNKQVICYVERNPRGLL